MTCDGSPHRVRYPLWINGVAQPCDLPAHDDETDCPDPIRCRAHSWLVTA